MKHAALGGVAGLSVAIALAASGHAARGVASPVPAAAPAALNPMANIAGVYAWMTGSNLNLVMDVSPLDDGSHSFDPSVLYVFHLTSKAGLGIGTTEGAETQVICKFASDTSVECWVTDASGTKDFVTGDPSNTAGITSLRGKVKVFAGRRSDPLFFNQAGFSSVVSQLKALPGTTPRDTGGCPQLDAGAAQALRNQLAAGSDAFAQTNVMAIVLTVDKSLINASGNSAVAIWGSTHAGS
jgi:hypothetical protein